MNEFFTWQLLATFSGATLATGIITQFIKEWPVFKNIRTQIISYIIALIIIAGANSALGSLTGAAEWGIVPLNALLVSIASNGGFDVVKNMFTME